MAAPYSVPGAVPPAPGAEDPTKVMWRRVFAFLVDFLILVVPFSLIVTNGLEYLDTDDLSMPAGDFCDAFLERFDGVCVQVGDQVYFDEGLDAVLVPWAVTLLAGFLIHAVLQGVTGMTVGKAIFGLRTVKEDGTPPGVARALGRWALLVVDGFFFGIVGLICAGTTPGHRRVGDMAVKTLVVRREAAGQPVVVPGLTTAFTSPYGQTWGQAAPPPGGGWGTDPQAGWGAPQADAGWGTPPQDGGWGAASAQSAPSADGPQWDEARGTYIQWDKDQQRWLQWDDTAKRWDVIPGQ